MIRSPFRNGLLLSCLLLTPLRAEQLFIRNQPFRGVSMGVGRTRYVELEPLAKALGFTVKSYNGGFLVTSDPTSEQGSEICEAGSAVVDGTRVGLITGTGGQVMIGLGEFCQTVGAKLVLNPSMDSADVYLESKSKARGPSLKDGWGKATGQEKPNPKSSQMKEGPAKAGVQYFETFALLPPMRDVGEMRDFGRKKAEIARFEAAYREIVTPTYFTQTYPRIQKALDKAIDSSEVLSQVPQEELEAYLASKPELSKNFLEDIAVWEGIRGMSAALIDQTTQGNEALVYLEQRVTDEVSGKSQKGKLILHVIKYKGKWRVNAREDE